MNQVLLDEDIAIINSDLFLNLYNLDSCGNAIKAFNNSFSNYQYQLLLSEILTGEV